MLHKRFKKQLASCLCAVLAATCVFSSIPVGAIGTNATSKNILAGTRYWTNLRDGDENSGAEGDFGKNQDYGRTALTDGKRVPIEDPKWTWHNENCITYHVPMAEVDKHIPIQFEFEDTRSFQQINIGFITKQVNNMNLPKEFSIEYKDADGAWTKLCTAVPGQKPADNQQHFIEEVYVLPDGDTVTTTGLRFSFDMDSWLWMAMDEIEVFDHADGTASTITDKDYVAPVGESCEKPSLTKDLSRLTTVKTGESTTLEVSANVTDGGTLSYQWYKGTSLIGENAPTYTVSNAVSIDNGDYKVVVTNSKDGFANSRITSTVCTLTVSEDIAGDSDNLVFGLPYENSTEYGDGSGNWPDSGNELTDGKTGYWVDTTSTHTQPEWVGYAQDSRNTITQRKMHSTTFDLGTPKTMKEFRLNTLGYGTSGITRPKQYRILTSNDKQNWTTAYDGADPITSEAGIYNFVYTNAQGITARYVKFEFDYEYWLFIDEIEVLSKPKTDVPTDDTNNIAGGKTYTTSVQADSAYPDSTVTPKLTDNRFGTLNYGDGIWVGYHTSSLEMILDLNEEKTFAQIEMNFLHTPTNGGISCPSNVKISYSSDQSQWTSLANSSIDTASLTDPSSYNYQYAVSGSGAKATARYIKVEITGLYWIFIDEIKVLTTSTIVTPGDPEPELHDPNNIAYGCAYTPAWPSFNSYQDRGGQLTDNKRGTSSYSGKEWVGFSSNGNPDEEGAARKDPLSIVLDLGAEKAFEQIKIGFLNASAVGIPFPSKLKIETSSDNATWKMEKEEDLTAILKGNGAKHYSYISAQTMNARYIKFTINFGETSWLFIDDIEVLAQKDTREDADTKPDNGLEYNLIRGYGVAPSRSTDHGLTSALTDGLKGVTFSGYDTGWVGFKFDSKNAKNNHVSLTVDLTESNSVSKIVFSTRHDPSNKIQMPQNITFSVSQGNDKWTVLKAFDPQIIENGTSTEIVWDGAIDGFQSTSEGKNMVYTKLIRVEFDLADAKDSYACVDELKVFGKRGWCSTAGVAINGDGVYNVAIAKPYTIYTKEPENAYPDTDGKELTDGVNGAASFSDSAWSGYIQAATFTGKQTDRWPYKTIVIDLQGEKSISSICATMYGNTSAGILMPWCVRTYASMDGVNWMALSRNSNGDIYSNGIHGYGWHHADTNGTAQDLTGDLDSVYVAKYIRVDFEQKNFNFIDEIEVLGTNGVAENAKQLTNLSALEESTDYLKVSKETTNNVQDMVLCYNGYYGVDAETGTGKGDWTPEQYRPYLTYVATDGNVVDTMFDTVLLLGIHSPYGASYTGVWDYSIVKAVAKDWEWYINKTFKEGGDVYNLNLAAKKAAQELGDPNYKVKLTVMFPGIDKQVTNFGDLGDRKNLNLSKEEDWQYAVNWWLDQVLTGMEKGNYEYIQFEGLYLLNEQADYNDTIQWTSNRVYEEGDYKFYWIPHFRSMAYLYGEDLGIDCTAFQPNHFFFEPEDEMDFGALGTKQVENALKMASYAHIGIEFECDDGMFDRPNKYNQGLDYLNAFEKRGADGPGVYRNWYQGLRAMGNCAASNNAVMRRFYDYSYQMMRGTYTQKEYISSYGTTMDPRSEGQNLKVYLGPDAPGNVPDMGNTDSGSPSGGGSIKPEKPTEPEKPSTGKLTWEKTNGVWKLKDADGKYVTGWKKIDGLWFYMNTDAVMQKGWQKVGNSWYYLKDSGAMATGWQKIGSTWYYLKDSGAMATGWNWINGKCYYLYQSGAMAANTTIGGYKVGADGAWIH